MYPRFPITHNEEAMQMAIIYQTDKRSGITYAYEATYYWDKEKQQSRSKRKLMRSLTRTILKVSKSI